MTASGGKQLTRGDLDRVFRAEHGRVVATQTRRLGDIDLAEEAAQEAYLIALQKWPDTGLPPNPGAKQIQRLLDAFLLEVSVGAVPGPGNQHPVGR